MAGQRSVVRGLCRKTFLQDRYGLWRKNKHTHTHRLAYVPGSHRMLTPGFEVVAAPPLGSATWPGEYRTAQGSIGCYGVL